MTRKIAVVTSSRADYCHLYWPLRELVAHPAVDLKIIALGPHLAPEFGCTASEIEKDGFRIDARIECLLSADRYEMLAPAAVATALRIPLAHIEGGEISEGAIDDAVRNALTKLSHLHFASTETARARIISMGEESWRVHRAGAPSLDHLSRSTLLSREEVEGRLGIRLR